jgi:hypothetical protein
MTRGIKLSLEMKMKAKDNSTHQRVDRGNMKAVALANIIR